VPTSNWTTLDQLFTSGKYDVGKNENGDFTLKEKGGRGFFQQIQLTMYCTGLRKCKLLIWLSADDHKFVDVFYDETYIINHVNRLRNFYAKKLLPCIVDEIQEDRLMMNKTLNKFMHI
jgi:hypothetical protein